MKKQKALSKTLAIHYARQVLIFLSLLAGLGIMLFSRTLANSPIQGPDSLGKGIQFEEQLDWKGLLAKARSDNKHIFIDFYATWCAPCKVMDEKVYPVKDVGDFFNKHFVSIKVQMDRTANDNEKVRQWYNTAKMMEEKYGINAYPTFLFLSPDGEPVHRAAGAFPVKRFLEIAANALNPETQSYKLAEKYNPAKMDTAEMRQVAVSIRHSAPDVAGGIALAYLKQTDGRRLRDKDNIDLITQFLDYPGVRKIGEDYIASLSTDEKLTKDNITFMSRLLQDSKDQVFQFFYNNTEKINSVMNPNPENRYWVVEKILERVITDEVVKPVVEKAKDKKGKVDWKKLTETIKKTYGPGYADRIVLMSQARWETGMKNKEGYARFLFKYLDKYGTTHENDWTLNNYAWYVFENCSDRDNLLNALKWSNRAVSLNPWSNWIDTYANLLHKLGRTEQAIKWQEIAVKLDAEGNEEFKTNLQKMKNGQHTWPQN